MTPYLAGTEPDDAMIEGWIESFHRDGFLVIPSVLSPDQCAVLRDDLDRDLLETYGVTERSDILFKERMFERSGANLALFALEPIVTFAERLIGGANGPRYSEQAGIPNANVTHVIHNNSFKVPPNSDGLAGNAWHQDDTPHVLSLDGKPLTNIRLNVLAFTVNYYLTDVMTVANGPTQMIPGSHLFGEMCPRFIPDREHLAHSCLGPMGTAVCFNNQVWHRGTANTSEVSRYITQVTYAKRLVGHKYAPFMNYRMPEHCYADADARLRRLLGFLPGGAYG